MGTYKHIITRINFQPFFQYRIKLSGNINHCQTIFTRSFVYVEIYLSSGIVIIGIFIIVLLF